MEGMADFRFECVLRGHGHKLHLPTALMQREIRWLARSMCHRSQV